MSLRDEIRYRILKHYTLSGFAEMIGMPYSTLQSVLNNIEGASVSNLKKIARGLNIPLDALISNDDINDNAHYSPILARAMHELSKEDLKKIEEITALYLKQKEGHDQ